MRQPEGGAGRRSAGLLGLCALVLLGVLATFLAVRDERMVEDQYDARAADSAAIKLRAAFEQTVGSLRGADAIAVSGGVDPAAYEAFARQVVENSSYSALAYAQIVRLDERAEFEGTSGVTIRDTDGAGGFTTATPRDLSIVVVDVYPDLDANRPVLGFDLAGDPVRRDAAARALASSTPMLSNRTSTATGARVGLSVVQAVHSPTGQAIGFVTSGIVVDDLIRKAGIEIDALAGFELWMDDEQLAGSTSGGATQSFDVAGRQVRVIVDDRRGMAFGLPLLIGMGTICLAVAVAWAAVRDRRQRSRLSRLSGRNRGIAELGQLLAGSLDSSAVLAEVARHAEPLLDAQWSMVVRRTPKAPGGEPVRPDEEAREPDRSEVPVPDSMRESMASAQQVAIVHPMAGGRALEVASRGEARPVVELISAPLVFSGGLCAGAVAFGWTTPLTPEQAEDRYVAAATIAELASRAMERAVISEVVQERAQDLSTLARTLASAHTSADVRRAVEAHVVPLIGAHAATLEGAAADPAAEGGRVIGRPIHDAAGHPVARLRVEWPQPRVLSQTEEAVLATVSDLIGQTLERTALSDQEHEIIVQLQQDLLPDVPAVDGLAIAFRYAPAMSVVGLGGDFYDIIVGANGTTYIVIGDITGHGSEAVAAMAELKSVIHHLLRSGHPMESVLEEADLVLNRRDYLATAQIVEIETQRNTLRYLNAGHPYPVLRPNDSPASLLTDGHRAMLGLGTGSEVRGAEIAFVAGDLLLLYTDGLIESRSRPIDQTMNELVVEVDAMEQDSVDDILDHVQATRSATNDRADDDLALIAVRRLP